MNAQLVPARPGLRRLAWTALAAAAWLAAPIASAHSPWIMPSGVNWSGQQAWVTVDGAVSEELFAIEHQALKLDAMQVTGPGGKVLTLPAVTTTRQRSSVDAQKYSTAISKKISQKISMSMPCAVSTM